MLFRNRLVFNSSKHFISEERKPTSNSIVENTLLFFLVTIVIILLSAFKNYKPTCKRFIFNTYAYVTFMILGILLVHTTIINNKYLYDILHKSTIFIVTFVLSLFTLVYLLMIPSKKILFKHGMLIVWLILFGAISWPVTERALSLDKDMLNQIILIFIVLVTTASSIVYLKPSIVSKSIGFPLMLALFTLIISQVLFILFGFNTKMYMAVTFFSIILFTLFISYDTKIAFEASKKCKEGNANYINYALSLFLDFINLFSSLER